MARLLLIETATEVCSVAVASEGEVLALVEKAQEVNCAAHLTLYIEKCVRQAGLALRQLDGVAVSSGPGSYTSLRVGISTAKGICYALDKPLMAVPTLQALAWAAQQSHLPAPSVRWVPMLDARRQEVWMAIFDELLCPCTEPKPLVLDEYFLQHLQQLALTPPQTLWVCAGNGMGKVPAHLWNGLLQRSSVAACSAAFLAALAEQRYSQCRFEDLAYFEPFYMKPPNITQPKPVLPPK